MCRYISVVGPTGWAVSPHRRDTQTVVDGGQTAVTFLPACSTEPTAAWVEADFAT